MTDTNRQGLLTVVDGVIVRSRLEAKWLRFFSALEIDWEYEPERFELEFSPSGYLPDFSILNNSYYVEIKPNWDVFVAESAKPIQFASSSPHKLIVAIGDPPGDQVFVLLPQSNAAEIRKLELKFFSSPHFSGISIANAHYAEAAYARAQTIGTSSCLSSQNTANAGEWIARFLTSRG